MKGAKLPSHTLKHMRTILDTIKESPLSGTRSIGERLSFLPEPQGADKASKKYVKKYGGLLLELFEYLQKKSLVHWAANGEFEIKSIRVEENMIGAKNSATLALGWTKRPIRCGILITLVVSTGSGIGITIKWLMVIRWPGVRLM